MSNEQVLFDAAHVITKGRRSMMESFVAGLQDSDTKPTLTIDWTFRRESHLSVSPLRSKPRCDENHSHLRETQIQLVLQGLSLAHVLSGRSGGWLNLHYLRTRGVLRWHFLTREFTDESHQIKYILCKG